MLRYICYNELYGSINIYCNREIVITVNILVLKWTIRSKNSYELDVTVIVKLSFIVGTILCALITKT